MQITSQVAGLDPHPPPPVVCREFGNVREITIFI